jgi:hypothetical protein
MKHATPVSPYTRALLAIFAALSIWQITWLFQFEELIEGLLPAAMSASMWEVVWSVVAVPCIVGAVTGSDLFSRIAFGFVAVVSTMGAATVVVNERPMELEFWAFGMAVVLALSCFVLLLSPLRTPPKGLEKGLPEL